MAEKNNVKMYEIPTHINTNLPDIAMICSRAATILEYNNDIYIASCWRWTKFRNGYVSVKKKLCNGLL